MALRAVAWLGLVVAGALSLGIADAGSGLLRSWGAPRALAQAGPAPIGMGADDEAPPPPAAPTRPPVAPEVPQTGPTASGAAATPGPWTGAKWEYHVEMLVWEEYRALPEYQALEKEQGGAWRASYTFQQRVLERAGQQGWELVSVRVPNEKAPSTVVFYFKRPAPKP